MGVLLPSTSAALIASAAGVAMSLIPYKKNLFDLSTQGTEINISAKFPGGLDPVEIPLVRNFADDRDAIEISPMEYNETSTTYNGRLITVAKIPKVRVTLSVIPHCPNDIDLAKIAYYSSVTNFNPVRYGADIELVITQKRIYEQAASFALLGVSSPTVKDAKATFKYGVLVSSSAVGTEYNRSHGAETTSSREGRQVASQYVFEFVNTRMEM